MALLIDHFIKRHNPELKRNFQGMDDDAVRVLMSLPWQGNVRELDNIIEHTMILAEGDLIKLNDLPVSVLAAGKVAGGLTLNLKDALRRIERQQILRELEQAGQDRKEAAKLLDISLSSLYRKIEELEIG